MSPRDPTAASTVISGHTLRSPGKSAAEVLAQAPGVQVARTGSGADLATASVRGATSAQTPVLLAGIPLNDNVAGTADLSVIPLWMIDRVDVYRGHAEIGRPYHPPAIGMAAQNSDVSDESTRIGLHRSGDQDELLQG